MIAALAPLLLAAALAGQAGGQGPAAFSPQTHASEVIAEIRVHGNLVVTNDDVLRIAGVAEGQPFTDTTIAGVLGRLRASKQFDDIQVLKRFASIEDTSKIALVIVVNEGPVRLKREHGSFTVVRRGLLGQMMFLPILSAEDGYGFTYGVRMALVGVAGEKSRLSMPVTWGGTKEAAAEIERSNVGPFSRVQIGAGLRRQRNPAFDLDDTRQRVWMRLERARGPWRAHASAGWQRVTFGEDLDHLRTVGADVAFDTRLDPVLPRNALYGLVAWEQVHFDTRPHVNRLRLDGRGYLGVFGQAVLAVRALRTSADQAQPPYLKPLLGGWSSLRGFASGTFTGDNIVAESVELRVPLNSPLNIAKVGVSLFADWGTAYQYGERFSDQTQHRSVGATMWVAATVFHMGVSVARSKEGNMKVNFGGGLTF